MHHYKLSQDLNLAINACGRFRPGSTSKDTLSVPAPAAGAPSSGLASNTKQKGVDIVAAIDPSKIIKEPQGNSPIVASEQNAHSDLSWAAEANADLVQGDRASAVRRLIKLLGHESFNIRWEAEHTLRGYGALATPFLKILSRSRDPIESRAAWRLVEERLQSYANPTFAEAMKALNEDYPHSLTSLAPIAELFNTDDDTAAALRKEVQVLNALTLTAEDVRLPAQRGAVFRERMEKHLEDFANLPERKQAIASILDNVREVRTSFGDDSSDRQLAAASLCKNLESLDLSSSKITDQGLSQLVGLGKLKVLQVDNTSISDSGLKAIQRLTSLQCLGLSHMQITDNGMSALKALTNLEILDLSSTKITDSGLRVLKSLPHLSQLLLRQTHITDKGMIEIAQCAELSLLDLTSCHITDTGLRDLKHMDRLRQLYLGGTHVTGSGFEFMVRPRNLWRLDLSDTLILDEELRHLSNFPVLEKLFLRNTALTDSCIPTLAKLSQLKALYLNGTKVSHNGIRWLRAALPKCTICSDWRD